MCICVQNKKYLANFYKQILLFLKKFNNENEKIIKK